MRFLKGTHRVYCFDEKLTKLHVIPAEFELYLTDNKQF
jgi:hypothetical protein